MIHHLSTRQHDYTIRGLLAGVGAALADRIRVHAYEDVLDRHPADLPDGTWIFTDYDRLPADDSARAARLWHGLAGRGCRMMNHPTRSLRRFALLRALHAAGVNGFDAIAIDDRRAPARFPVFIRRADAHAGPASQLLAGREAYDRALASMRARAWALHSFIAVEFCDGRGADGLYRKYGAIKIGPAIVAQHLLATTEWIARRGGQGVWTEERIEDERRYVEDNPHRAAIARAFEIAGVDYGRIDYCLRDGRVQVFEINSNPSFVRGGSTGALRHAAAAIANGRIVDAFARLAGGDGAPCTGAAP
ncbi:MAG: hypothetical protein AB7O45_04870 [Alphaproteobacteria bacterium]